MASDDSWMRAELGGTTRANLITRPEVIAALIRRAKRPLVIAGHELSIAGPESVSSIGFFRDLSRIRGMEIVATSYGVRSLVSEGIKIDFVMGCMEIVDRLCDPGWKGFDGDGPYDLVILAGIPYSLSWILFSGLRNGAVRLKTISLDRHYQPHASWSFGNMAISSWSEQLQGILTLLEKE